MNARTLLRALAWSAATVVSVLTVWYVVRIAELKRGEFTYSVYAPNQVDRYPRTFGPATTPEDATRAWAPQATIPGYCFELLRLAEDHSRGS